MARTVVHYILSTENYFKGAIVILREISAKTGHPSVQFLYLMINCVLAYNMYTQNTQTMMMFLFISVLVQHATNLIMMMIN
jgi:hypothetical protein